MCIKGNRIAAYAYLLHVLFRFVYDEQVPDIVLIQGAVDNIVRRKQKRVNLTADKNSK
jgi:hypothetical protein